MNTEEEKEGILMVLWHIQELFNCLGRCRNTLLKKRDFSQSLSY